MTPMLGAGLYIPRSCAIAKGYPNQNGALMPSPDHIPDDDFPESAIGPADLDSPETPEADPQYLLVQSGFGLHVRQGREGDQGLRSEDEIAELVRRALYYRKTLTLHIEF